LESYSPEPAVDLLGTKKTKGPTKKKDKIIVDEAKETDAIDVGTFLDSSVPTLVCFFPK
jgi:hypothetical protein